VIASKRAQQRADDCLRLLHPFEVRRTRSQRMPIQAVDAMTRTRQLRQQVAR